MFNMEKQKAEYHFKKDYTDAKGNPQAVTVILEINYKTGNFSVNPFFSNKNGFLFRQSSNNWQMWKAVLHAIEDAIDFAHIEIKNEKEF